MRVLLRNYGNEVYVWKEAKYENEAYFIKNKNDGWDQLSEHQIVSIDGTENTGFVICKNCGAVIKDTPEDIEKHYADMEANCDCTKCGYVSFTNVSREKEREVAAKDNGLYRVTESFDAELACSASYWNSYKVDYAKQKGICAYTKCRKDGVRKPNDIFSQYPGIFDKALTVDALSEKKLRFDGYNGDYFLYDMKSRGTIKACVNEAGIVECFQISTRGRKMYFFYSEKYEKLFYKNGASYAVGKPYWFPDNKIEEAYKKIKELYKGVDEE